MSDQPIEKTATYTTHNILKGQISMPSARFEPVIPAIELKQTYAFDRRATEISFIFKFA
jgi:hypothetical protein